MHRLGRDESSFPDLLHSSDDNLLTGLRPSSITHIVRPLRRASLRAYSLVIAADNRDLIASLQIHDSALR